MINIRNFKTLNAKKECPCFKMVLVWTLRFSCMWNAALLKKLCDSKFSYKLEGRKKGSHRPNCVLLVGLDVCEALGEVQDGGASIRAANTANPAILLQGNVNE